MPISSIDPKTPVTQPVRTMIYGTFLTTEAVVLPNTQADIDFVMDAAGTIAALSVAMPANTVALPLVNGQKVTIHPKQIVTTLTMTTPATAPKTAAFQASGGATALAVATPLSWVWNDATSEWMKS